MFGGIGFILSGYRIDSIKNVPPGNIAGRTFFLFMGPRAGRSLRVILTSLSAVFLLSSITPAKDIIVPADYRSIQGAVNSAVSGDTVIIENGRYEENVVITKPIILKSASGYGNVIIEAKNKNAAAIKIDRTSGAAITGVTAKGSSNMAGIHLYRSSGCRIFNNLSEDNHTGIYAEYSSGNTISKNIARENTNGISLYFSNNNRLDDNIADYNSEKGITVFSSNGNILAGNTANSNYWNGITLWSANNNILTDNTALDNSYSIVESYSEDNVMTGNRTMRRLYYILPIALAYFGIIIYFVEKKFFELFFSAAPSK